MRHNLYHAGNAPTNNCNNGFNMWPNVDVGINEQVGPSAAHRGHTTHQVIERCLDFRPVPPAGMREAWNNQTSLTQYAETADIAEGDELAVIVIPFHEDWKTLYYTICSPVEGLTMGIREVYSGADLVTGIDMGQPAGTCALMDVVDDLGLDRMSCDENRMLAWVIEALPPVVEDPCLCPKNPMDDLCICMQAEVVHIHTGK